jgi:small-conductance mechanosensitive channel
MRFVPGLQQLEATPVPTPGGDGGDDGLFSGTAAAAWDRVVELLKGLAGASLNLVWAAVIVFAIVWLSGKLRRRVRTALDQRVGGRNNLPALLDNVLQIGVYVFAAVVALGVLGADSTALVSTFGLITAAISLSLQDVLKNFVAGLYLLAEQPFVIGDRLEVSGQSGTVEQINVRTTVLRNDKHEQVLVPNYQVFSQVVNNRTAYRLSTLTVQVTGVKEDADAAIAGVQASLTEIEGAATTPPKIDLTKLSPDGNELTLTVWIAPGQDLRRLVLQRLRARFPDATLTVT